MYNVYIWVYLLICLMCIANGFYYPRLLFAPTVKKDLMIIVIIIITITTIIIIIIIIVKGLADRFKLTGSGVFALSSWVGKTKTTFACLNRLASTLPGRANLLQMKSWWLTLVAYLGWWKYWSLMSREQTIGWLYFCMLFSTGA